MVEDNLGQRTKAGQSLWDGGQQEAIRLADNQGAGFRIGQRLMLAVEVDGGERCGALDGFQPCGPLGAVLRGGVDPLRIGIREVAAAVPPVCFAHTFGG